VTKASHKMGVSPYPTTLLLLAMQLK